MEAYLLWGLRVGFVLTILGLLWPRRTKRSFLGKRLNSTRSVFYARPQGKLMRLLDKITENPSLKPIMLNPTSDEYKKLEAEIAYADGAGGLTPNIVQLLKYALPPIIFIVLAVWYVFNSTFRVVELNPTDFGRITDTAKTIFSQYVSAGQVVAMNKPKGINLYHFGWLFAFSMSFYFAPNLYIKWRKSIRNEKIKRELPIIETFIVIMLKTGNHTVYDILLTLIETTDFFKPYLIMCRNEFFVDPKAAIQRMADRVGDEEFQVVCNGLKQAVDMNKSYTAEFINQHLDQLKKIQQLKRQAQIRQKPLVLACVLALPLFSVIVMWMYPWFVKALNMFSFGL